MEVATLGSAGLYFTCKCRNAECAHSGKSVLVYVGVGKEFLFAESWRESRCGKCAASFASVLSVGFFKCKWTYNGVIADGSEVREPFHYSYGFTMCTGPKRHKWRSLCLGAYHFSQEELQNTQMQIFRALESPVYPSKRQREVDVRDQGEGMGVVADMRDVSEQTAECMFPDERLQRLQSELEMSEDLKKCLKKEVRRKEDRFEKLRKSILLIDSDVAILKRQ